MLIILMIMDIFDLVFYFIIATYIEICELFHPWKLTLYHEFCLKRIQSSLMKRKNRAHENRKAHGMRQIIHNFSLLNSVGCLRESVKGL